MVTVVKPDGIVAAYVWNYARGMEMMRYVWDAALAFDAETASGRDEGALSHLRP